MDTTPPPRASTTRAFEHDACGVSFVVDLQGPRSHDIVEQGIGALCNLDHRGAPGAEINTGDGAGILDAGARRVPARRRRLRPAARRRLRHRHRLPAAGDEARGRARPTADRGDRRRARASSVLGWRDVPVEADRRSAPPARASMPTLPPAVRRPDPTPSYRASTSTAGVYVVRKRIEHEVVGADGDAASCTSRACRPAPSSTRACSPRRSSREFFPDLADERVESALALVHRRFSTNTFPSWPLAHPYRYLAHNGEINTRAGQPQLDAGPRGAARDRPASPATSTRIFPICTPGGVRHRPASTRCSSCCTSAAAACPTPC